MGSRGVRIGQHPSRGRCLFMLRSRVPFSSTSMSGFCETEGHGDRARLPSDHSPFARTEVKLETPHGSLTRRSSPGEQKWSAHQFCSPREAVELADRSIGHPSVRLPMDHLSVSLVSYPRIYHLSLNYHRSVSFFPNMSLLLEISLTRRKTSA